MLLVRDCPDFPSGGVQLKDFDWELGISDFQLKIQHSIDIVIWFGLIKMHIEPMVIPIFSIACGFKVEVEVFL